MSSSRFRKSNRKPRPETTQQLKPQGQAHSHAPRGSLRASLCEVVERLRAAHAIPEASESAVPAIPDAWKRKYRRLPDDGYRGERADLMWAAPSPFDVLLAKQMSAMVTGCTELTQRAKPILRLIASDDALCSVSSRSVKQMIALAERSLEKEGKDVV